jgi:hypothetical protein
MNFDKKPPEPRGFLIGSTTGTATLSVFWQFESLDGDLKGTYLSEESEQALKH